MAFLEYEICCERNASALIPLRPVLEEAVKTCRLHAEAGAALPHAYFTCGKLHVLMGDAYAALTAYAKAVQFSLDEKNEVAMDIFDDQLETLTRLDAVQKHLPGRDWVRESLFKGIRYLLHAARALREGAGSEMSLEELRDNARRKVFEEPVAIVAGGCSKSAEQQVRKYLPTLGMALEHFRGTLIGGGTDAGVSGMLGEIAAELRVQKKLGFELVGYHPRNMPADINQDKRYDDLIVCDGNDFSPLDALQTWVDLIAAGVNPKDVRIVGIDGGRIAALEYRIALALGAEAGLLEQSGREAAELFTDPNWRHTPRMMRLVNDGMTVLSFLNSHEPDMSEEDLERAARAVHEKYCSDNKHNAVDPAMRPWEELADGLKASNRGQAAYAVRILRALGYDVRPATGAADAITSFEPDEVELMAAMEHGRWNIERTRAGWKLGPRDPDAKVTPYLVAWEEVPEKIKGYDRDAVNEFPVVLANAGFEIFRTEPKEA